MGKLASNYLEKCTAKYCTLAKAQEQLVLFSGRQWSLNGARWYGAALSFDNGICSSGDFYSLICGICRHRVL